MKEATQLRRAIAGAILGTYTVGFLIWAATGDAGMDPLGFLLLLVVSGLPLAVPVAFYYFVIRERGTSLVCGGLLAALTLVPYGLLAFSGPPWDFYAFMGCWAASAVVATGTLLDRRRQADRGPR